MADLRIKVAKDKAKIVKALRAGENSTGLFQTYYEVIVFAAALGISRNKFVPIRNGEFSKDIDPIRQEQFASKGYDQIIDLLAVTHSKDPKVLSSIEEFEEKKVSIFEAYANGGLELLQDLLRGVDNHSQQLLLLLATEREDSRKAPENLFDLSFL
jgi:dnd system-associated protein 4